jgi:ABC-type polysaccharide/polyol phosphate export permease
MARQIRDVVQHWDLLMLLVRKELRVKYKGTVLGFAWSMLNPLLMMAVYSIVFSVIARPTVARYPVLVFSGMLPWTAVIGTIASGSTSVITNGNLVKRVKFPVELIPVTTAFSNMVNLLLGLIVLFAVAILWPPIQLPTVALLALPLLLALQTLFLTGAALAVSAITVYFRDLEHLLQVFLMLWFFGSPILYPLSQFPPDSKAHMIEVLNPMTWLMDSYQHIWHDGTWPNWRFVLAFAVLTVVTLVLGSAIFRRASRRFAEEV